MSAAKTRLEQELQRLESLLRLLDDYENEPNDQTLGLLTEKLKLIVPELRALSTDPAYKTSECAPLLVTLGQGVKSAVQRTRDLHLTPPPAAAGTPRTSGRHSETSQAMGMPEERGHEELMLAEPKPLRGWLRKRGDKGLVKNWKLRYFQQRGDKIMYYRGDKPEDMRQAVGWIDLGKMMGVERVSTEPFAFDVHTAGRTYCLQAPKEGGEQMRDYWVDGLRRYRQYRQDSIARMNQPASSSVLSAGGSPRSSAWSGMSVLSDEESEVPEPGTPLMREQEPEDSPMSAARAMSFRMSPERSSSARKLVFEEEEDAQLQKQKQRSTEIMPAPVAAAPSGPTAKETELQEALDAALVRANAAIKRATSAEEATRTAEETVARLRAELATAGRQAAELRDASRQEREATEKAEHEAREARSRAALADGDLRAVRAELEVERARRERPPSAPLSGGRGGRTRELERDLEREREASEAARERVRFLGGQLEWSERHAKAERELHQAHVSALRKTLKRRDEEAGDAALRQELKALERDYFMALGIGLKLHLASQGLSVNVDVTALFSEVADVLPHSLYNRYLSLRFDQLLYPDQYDRIADQLTAMLRDFS